MKAFRLLTSVAAPHCSGGWPVKLSFLLSAGGGAQEVRSGGGAGRFREGPDCAARLGPTRCSSSRLGRPDAPAPPAAPSAPCGIAAITVTDRSWPAGRAVPSLSGMSAVCGPGACIVLGYLLFGNINRSDVLLVDGCARPDSLAVPRRVTGTSFESKWLGIKFSLFFSGYWPAGGRAV